MARTRRGAERQRGCTAGLSPAHAGASGLSPRKSSWGRVSSSMAMQSRLPARARRQQRARAPCRAEQTPQHCPALQHGALNASCFSSPRLELGLGLESNRPKCVPPATQQPLTLAPGDALAHRVPHNGSPAQYSAVQLGSKAGLCPQKHHSTILLRWISMG